MLKSCFILTTQVCAMRILHFLILAGYKCIKDIFCFWYHSALYTMQESFIITILWRFFCTIGISFILPLESLITRFTSKIWRRRRILWLRTHNFASPDLCKNVKLRTNVLVGWQYYNNPPYRQYRFSETSKRLVPWKCKNSFTFHHLIDLGCNDILLTWAGGFR